jgi:hypothetical protein
VVVASLAPKLSASNEAMRKGGFSARVPCVVDAATVEVVLSDPQAVSSDAIQAAHKTLRVYLRDPNIHASGNAMPRI